MSDLSIALVQAAVLLGAGVLSHRRWVVFVAVPVVAAATIAVGGPQRLDASPFALAADSVGIVVGLVLGWAAVRAHEARRSRTARQQDLLSAVRNQERDRRRRRIGLSLAAVVAAAGGAFLALGDGAQPGRPLTTDALLARWSSLAAGLRGQPAPPVPAAAAGPGRDAAGAKAAPKGAPVAGSIAATGPADTRPRPRPAHASAQTPARAIPDASAPGRTDPPVRLDADVPAPVAGDLRHCLELPSSSDVLRCADRRR